MNSSNKSGAMHSTSDTQLPAADAGRLDLRVVPLVACPLCGAESGYRPDEGSTCRWWSLRCASCRQEVTECAAGKNLYFTNETRWPHCDEAWNAAGAYADAWRVKAEMLRAAIERACASYPDDAAAPTCVAILREALRHNASLSRQGGRDDL